MGEAVDARYWCHMCSQVVSAVMDVELKCSLCDSGFIEEMEGREEDPDEDVQSDRALSLWAPILLGMMGGGQSRRRRRFPLIGDEEVTGESEHERDFDSFLRRRRRNSAAMLQLLEGLRAGLAFDSDNSETERERDIERESRDRDRDVERLILINPFNRAMIVDGSLFDSDHSQDQNRTGASLGDYFIGQGLDLLLQHLAENDPNRYGTPPAQKEAIEAMPTVKINEVLQCSVCLDDFEIGSEAKEMPCKHKFHPACILPWLELHCSCPLCRFQIPSHESKDQNESRSADVGVGTSTDRGGVGGSDGHRESDRVSGSRRRFSWPFNGLFSLSGSQSGGNSSSGPSPSASGSSSHTDES